MANRAAAAARGVLGGLGCDVRVATDAAAARDCAPAAGVGVVLIAEHGALARGAEADAAWASDAAPEALGESAARALVAEVRRGGCCDDASQPLLFALMSACPEDASFAVVGPLTDRSAATLRLLRKFMGVTFKLARRDDGTVRASCLGAGYRNAARPVS